MNLMNEWSDDCGCYMQELENEIPLGTSIEITVVECWKAYDKFFFNFSIASHSSAEKQRFS